MVDVQFVQTMNFPVEVLLPLRLIVFNGNVRRKLITGTETSMPQPLAEWLAKQSPLSGKVVISDQSSVMSDQRSEVRGQRAEGRDQRAEGWG